MRVTDFNLTKEQISGTPNATGILTGVRARKGYIDGKPTDTITHYIYESVFDENGYEKVNVKIKGDKPLITSEMLEAKGGSVKVRFKGLTGKFYRTNSGEYALSCSAEGLEVLN